MQHLSLYTPTTPRAEERSFAYTSVVKTRRVTELRVLKPTWMQVSYNRMMHKAARVDNNSSCCCWPLLPCAFSCCLRAAAMQVGVPLASVQQHTCCLSLRHCLLGLVSFLLTVLLSVITVSVRWTTVVVGSVQKAYILSANAVVVG